MIPEYCKQCLNRQMNSYEPTEFEEEKLQASTRSEMEIRKQNINVSSESNFSTAPGSPTLLGVEYTQGYLRSIIGKRIRVTFLIGTDSLTDRTGILEEVGISYIVVRDVNSGVHTMCDIYSIKFVTIFNR